MELGILLPLKMEGKEKKITRQAVGVTVDIVQNCELNILNIKILGIIGRVLRPFRIVFLRHGTLKS